MPVLSILYKKNVEKQSHLVWSQEEILEAYGTFLHIFNDGEERQINLQLGNLEYTGSLANIHNSEYMFSCFWYVKNIQMAKKNNLAKEMEFECIKYSYILSSFDSQKSII